jgi:hypothetical protein
MTTVNEPVVGAVDMVTAHAMFRRCPARTAMSRPTPWERLEGAARLTVVSAPAGSRELRS